MGILTPEKSQATPAARRRRSTGLNFGELKPLTADNTKNFSGYRDPSAQSPKSNKRDEDRMDSDADDEDETKIKTEEGDDDKDDRVRGLLSPEDAVQSGELAEGVRKIKVSFCPDLPQSLTTTQLKRQHSAEPMNQPGSPVKRGSISGSPISGAPLIDANDTGPGIFEAPSAKVAKSSLPSDLGTEGTVGSPFKKQRASLPGFDESARRSLGAELLGAKSRGNSEGNLISNALGPQSASAAPLLSGSKMDEDDEL
jgi:hypothetical protein